jgi:hypothetical protein
MQLYSIIYTLISLKGREKKIEGREATKKRERKIKRIKMREKQKVEGKREKLYLFNE